MHGLSEGLRLTGRLRAVVRDRRGRVVSDQEVGNLIVTDGRTLLWQLLANITSNRAAYFAVGTSNLAPQLTDHTLVTEVYRASVTSYTVNGNVLVITFFLGTTLANGNTLQEAGTFTAAAGGTMFSRAILSSPIVKTSAFSVTFTWTLTLS